MRRAVFFLCAVMGVGAACAQPTVIEDIPGDDAGTPDTAPCTSMCGGMCVDTKTDATNCGKCGTTCPMGATCVQGSCQCPPNQTKCGTQCVDTKTDNTNCGKCGTICGNDAGMIPGGGTYGCNMGTCGIICPMGKTECSGACIDPKTDNENCGMCGTACMMGTETCTDGLCCTTGQTVCSGMCTDTQFDAKNCKTCGTVCPMGMPYCNKGVCTQCDNTVLLLDDGSSGTPTFVTKANQAGLAVTLVANGVTTYTGSPSASNFSVTVAMVGGSFATDMPTQGQQAIVTAQGQGRGFVATDWAGYEVYSSHWTTLKSINLGTYTTGGGPGTVGFTLTQNGHPIWTGLPMSFNSTTSMGCQVASITNGGTSIANVTGACSGAGVIVRSSPNGRLVYVGHAAGWNGNTTWVNDTNMVNLTINAIKWATGCLL